MMFPVIQLHLICDPSYFAPVFCFSNYIQLFYLKTYLIYEILIIYNQLECRPLRLPILWLTILHQTLTFARDSVHIYVGYYSKE